MRYIFRATFLIILCLIACTKSEESKSTESETVNHSSLEIPANSITKSLLNYNSKISLWTVNEKAYSGYALSYYSDSTVKEKIGILNGKKENLSMLWHSNGNLKQVANYSRGKLHGTKKVWSSRAVLLSNLNYKQGKPHGQQKIWYPSGELHKVLNLNEGKEEGIQQAFRKNGALYANYEAKEGRVFGLKKTALCYGLESESIQYEK